MRALTVFVWSLVVLNALLTDARARNDRDVTRRTRVRQQPEGESRTQVASLVRSLLDNNYYKMEAPRPDKPTEVKIGIYVNSFHSINEKTMDFGIDFYLRESWRDPRLEFTPLNRSSSGQPPQSKIRLAFEDMKRLWQPDIFIRAQKRANFHYVPTDHFLVSVQSSGKVWQVTKVSATIACHMKLHKYPFDTQRCAIMFESFGYTMDSMYFSWLDSPVDVDPAVQLPQFTLQDQLLYDCSQNYTAGAFPCLEIQLVLKRDIGFYLIHVYFPTMLITVLSWASFWMDIVNTEARMSLGIVAVLTIIAMGAGVNQSLPQVSYVKAIDVWMSSCLVFVSAALVEYVIVTAVSRRRGKPAARGAESLIPPAQCQEKESGKTAADQTTAVATGPRLGDEDAKRRARRVDMMSRILFPFLFLLFNVIYWVVYTAL